MTTINLKSHLEIAKDAAELAGVFLAGYDRTTIKIKTEEGKDIKINADVRSEEIIFKHLMAHSAYTILSEEKGMVNRDDNNFMWIVDPLDGTMNYFRNMPMCCVSIGLWQKEKPLLGVIYDFNTGEYFTGIVGQGAWRNDQPIHVSGIDKKEKAILATGFPANTDFSRDAIEGFITDLKTYKKIRMFGSAALSTCYVACGKVEAYLEKDIMLWDIAGGIPIVLAAGGQAEKKTARRESSFHVFISNGQLENK